MNFNRLLLGLIKEAHKYQYAGIADTKDEVERKRPRLFFTKQQWILIAFSSLVAYFMQGGFNDAFAGYVVSGLSLFAGLFFSFVLMMFDDFRGIDFERFRENARMKLIGIRLKNYYKKSTALSFYIILLSLLCILLLSVSLFDMKINLGEVPSDFPVVTQAFVVLKKVVGFLYRATTIYFLLDFLWITLYLIASFYDYVESEYDKIRLKDG